jgi:hypothetical protein
MLFIVASFIIVTFYLGYRFEYERAANTHSDTLATRVTMVLKLSRPEIDSDLITDSLSDSGW